MVCLGKRPNQAEASSKQQSRFTASLPALRVTKDRCHYGMGEPRSHPKTSSRQRAVLHPEQPYQPSIDVTGKLETTALTDGYESCQTTRKKMRTDHSGISTEPTSFLAKTSTEGIKFDPQSYMSKVNKHATSGLIFSPKKYDDQVSKGKIFKSQSWTIEFVLTVNNKETSTGSNTNKTESRKRALASVD